MNLTDVSAFDAARLAAAAAFGWGLVSAFWRAVSGAFGASMTRYGTRCMSPETLRALADLQEQVRRDDNNPPGPPASA